VSEGKSRYSRRLTHAEAELWTIVTANVQPFRARAAPQEAPPAPAAPVISEAELAARAAEEKKAQELFARQQEDLQQKQVQAAKRKTKKEKEAEEAAAKAAAETAAAEAAKAAEATAKRSDAPALAQTPERELERIAGLRVQGRHDEADKALAEFRKRYPDYRIAEEMRARVERR